MSSKSLIIGGSGYVGKSLARLMGADNYVATYSKSSLPNGLHFDATANSLKKLLQETGNIFHTAYLLYGITNIDECFKNKQLSRSTNVDSYKRVLSDLFDADIKVIFASSDAVFDGTRGNWTELDTPNPIIMYGRQKLEVENFIKESKTDSVIARLSKVIGSEVGGGNLLYELACQVFSGSKIRYVSGLITNPIDSNDVARLLIELSSKKYTGLYHLSGSRAISRKETVEILYSELNKINDKLKLNLEGVTQTELGLMETRPLNVSMVSKKVQDQTGISVNSIEQICKIFAKNLLSKI